MKRKETLPEPNSKKRKDDDDHSPELEEDSTLQSSQTLSQTVNTFKEHLKGVNLSSTPITIENALEFKKHLIKKLPNGSQIASEFTIGFISFISHKENLHKSLLPFKRSDAQNLEQDIPRLILHQFKWIDFVVNSSKLTKLLLNVLTNAPPSLKKEILAFLPEIVDDQEQHFVVEELTKIMEESSEFLTTCLDSISNFSIDLSTTPLVDFVLSKLDGCNLEDLPIIIKFLLITCKENPKQIISSLRASLDFTSLQQAQAEEANLELQIEVLIMESFKTGLAANKVLSEAFLTEIAKITTRQEAKMLDLWICILLLSFQTTQKKSDLILRKKIKTGVFDELLLVEAISTHGDALSPYFPQIISMASSYIKNSEPAIQKFAVILYQHIFVIFSSVFQRQQFLSHILTHVGSTNKVETNSALDVLTHLANKNLTSLRLYSQYLQGMLDFLEALSEDQIKRIYSILAILSFRKSLDQAEPNDVLSITVMKQLQNGNLMYTRMAIIGVGVLLEHLGSFTPEYAQKHGSHLQELTQRQDENLTELILLAITVCNKTANSNSAVLLRFCYDQLANAIHAKTSEKVKSRLADLFVPQFEKLYLKQVQRDNPEASYEPNLFKNVKPIIDYDAFGNDTDSTQLVVSILPFILKKDYEVIYNISSMFKLVFSIKADLEIIQLPILTADITSFESMGNPSKDAVCMNLFLVIHWIREVISCYSKQGDRQLESLFLRSYHLMQLERHLDECLFVHKSFSIHNFLIDSLDKMKIVETKEATDDKKKKKPVYSRTPEVKYTAKLRPYLREMDLSYLEILKYVNHDKCKKLCKSGGLYYLLSDLDLKIAFVSKRNVVSPFSGSSEKIKHDVLDTIPTEIFLTNVISILAPLMTKISELNNLSNTDTVETDEPNDNFTSLYHDPCIVIIYDILAKILDLVHIPLYRSKFDLLLNQLNGIGTHRRTQHVATQSDPIKTCFDFFKTKLHDCVTVGIEQIKILNILMVIIKGVSLDHQEEDFAEISDIALDMLKKKWRRVKKDQLVPVLEALIGKSLDPIKTLENLHKVILEFRVDKMSDGEDYPSINKETFPVFLTFCLSTAAELIPHAVKMEDKDNKQLVNKGLKNLKRLISVFDGLIQWDDIKNTIAYELPLALIPNAILSGKKFTTNFLKMIPFFKFAIKKHSLSASVADTYSGMNALVRILQSFCSNVKVTKSASTTSAIPILKKNIEKIILKLKEVLSGNQKAIVVKNLNSRNLKGEIIDENNDKYYQKLVKKKSEESGEEEEEEEEEEHQDDAEEEENLE